MRREWAGRRRRWGVVMAFSLLGLVGAVYVDLGLLSVAGVVASLALFVIAYVRTRLCPRCRRMVSHPNSRTECPYCELPIREDQWQ